MNKIEMMQTRLQEQFPNAEVSLTKPACTDGHWILDVAYQSRTLMIDWLPPDTLSISSLDDSIVGYGEGPDEVYSKPEEALQRVVQLLTSDERPSPSLPALLSRIRVARRITQADLARVLGVTQASISGMERRHDIQLSTLRRVIGALGGKLEIAARFPDASYTMVGPLEPLDENIHGSTWTDSQRLFCPALERCGQREEVERIEKSVRKRGLLAA